jgi:hypothetical protein
MPVLIKLINFMDYFFEQQVDAGIGLIAQQERQGRPYNNVKGTTEACNCVFSGETQNGVAVYDPEF